MIISKLIIGVIMTILVLPTAIADTVNASINVQKELNEKERESGFYDEEGYVLDTKLRPAINLDLDVDEDCNLAYELKCIPGSQQRCRDLGDFSNFENNVCRPSDCPQGYVDIEDDEHGICISYEECESDDYLGGYVLVKEEGLCAYKASVCGEPEHSAEDYCIEYCEENPDRFACKAKVN